ncbi:hypothetical protein PVAND_012019 [Polypedilum vanderplanki]|uniref:Breast cancer type 2 susceptibility protein-like protein n=1 Tax=Polypedilum vanderplanki TaxID=319348 RepID=A0A9J6CL31_POLVA|nr:hypothetical protein PVAND_012019 [Polypedilum vanderplanki]
MDTSWLDYDSDEDDKNIQISKLGIDESIEFEESFERNKKIRTKKRTGKRSSTRQAHKRRKKEEIDEPKQEQEGQSVIDASNDDEQEAQNVIDALNDDEQEAQSVNDSSNDDEQKLSEAQWEKEFIDELSQTVVDFSPGASPEQIKDCIDKSFLEVSHESNFDDLNQSIHELSQKLESSVNGVQLVNNVIGTVTSNRYNQDDIVHHKDIQEPQEENKKPQDEDSKEEDTVVTINKKKTVRFKELDVASSSNSRTKNDLKFNETTLIPKIQQPFGFAFASGKNIALDEKVLSNIKNRFQKEEENINYNEISETSIDDFNHTAANTTIQSPKTPLMTSTPIVKKSFRKTSLYNRVANNFLLTQHDLEIDYDHIDQIDREQSFKNSKSDNNEQQNFVGFAFASGKHIAVDEKVLSNMKNKFQIEDNTDINNIEIDETETNLNESEIKKDATEIIQNENEIEIDENDFKNVDPQPIAINTIQSQKEAYQKSLFSKYEDENYDKSNAIPSNSNRMPSQPRTNDFNQIPDCATQIKYEEINDLITKVEIAESIRIARVEELKKQIEFISKKSKDDLNFSFGKLFIQKSQTNRLKLRDYHSSSLITLKESMANRFIPYDQITQHLFDMSCYTNVPHNEVFVTIADDAKLVFNSKNSGTVSFNEIKHSFLAMKGIKPKLLPEAWVQNAYEMIFWKLNFMENFLEKIDKDMVLNPENILLQMKYRYDREIHKFQSPPLRRILEKDVPAGHRIVLKVVNISYTSENGYELELSDGWYKIRTLIDSCLAEAITKRKIQVHSKLLICNMELKQTINDTNVFVLLEASKLKISGNSTRLVEWNTKMGFCKIPFPFQITLDSVKNNGGIIGKLRIVITHVYNPIYVETVEDKRVYRSERMQNKIENENEVVLQKMYERVRQKVLDKIQVELIKRHKEILQYPKGRELTIDDLCDFFEVDTESEFALNLIENLNPSDLAKINNIVAKRKSELEDKIKILMQQESDRRVTQVIKFRAADADNPKLDRLICWWHPNEEVFDIIKIGKMIELIKATTDNINIIINQKTIFKELKKKPDLTKFKLYFRKETKFQDIKEDFSPLHNEFDIACIIIYIAEPSINKNQEVFIADEHYNLLCVNFYIDISEYAYDNVLTEGRILYVRNLQWRNSFRKPHKNIPEAFAIADSTTFVTNPGEPNEKQRINELTNAINSNSEYMGKCREKIISLIGPDIFKKEGLHKKYGFLKKISLPAKPPVDLSFSND